MKKIKAKYNNTTKQLNPTKINDYDTLLMTVKSQFKELVQPFKMQYKDSYGDNIEIENQADYDNIDFTKPLVIYINKGEMGIQNLSRIQSTNKTQLNQGDSILKIMEGSNAQSAQNFVPIENNIPIHIQPSPNITQTNVIYPNPQSPQENSNPLTKVQLDFTESLRRREGEVRKWEGYCALCKNKFQGLRWKYTQVTQIDNHVCLKCYKEAKSSQNLKGKHTFLQIDDTTLWSKFNFGPAIHKMFDPKYDKQRQASSMNMSEWITRQDILSNQSFFSKKVWDCSQPIVKTICDDFDKWQKDYQSQQVR